MKQIQLQAILLPIMAVGFLWGCGASENSAMASYDDGDYASSDADSDIDSDADSDSDSDADADNSDEGSEPEVETKFDYRIPVSSGRYVFIADTLNNKVIAVDSVSLEIFTTKVGATPTHLVPLNDNGEVAVISLNADEVTLIRMADDGSAAVTDMKIRPDTNALAVSPAGRYVIAFWDAIFESEYGSPNTDQEISIIDTTSGAEKTFNVAVGIHPLSVQFSADDSRAFVITESGVDIIDLNALSETYFPANISLFDFTVVDPELTETVIDPSGNVAIGRREDEAKAYVALLDGSNEIRSYDLSGIPTDVDISKDGTFAIYTIREQHQVALASLPLPASAETNPFTYIDLGDQQCGSATISNDGQFIALYTTIASSNSNRKILTVLSRTATGFEVDGTLLNRDIKGILPAPDSGALLVIHEKYNSTSDQGLPYSYSLVKLPALQSKFQQLVAEPTQLLMTNDGSYAYMLLPSSEVQIINMDTFIVDQLALGSVPQAAGYTPLTDKVFVSQIHPSGRMTFMNVEGTDVKTITGYTLNDQSTN